MKELFQIVFNMSISASFVIIGILALRWICRSLPKRWTILLWLAAAFRLLCPISFSSPLSVFQYTTAVNGQLQHVADTSVLIPDMNFNGTRMASDMKAAEGFMELIVSNFYMIWITGAALLLLRMIVKYWKLNRLMKASIATDQGYYLHDDIESPFVFGLLLPKIYLPSNMDENKKSYVLLHEQAHLKRRDYIWKTAAYLLLCVYWFNPMVWIGYYFLSLDMEMACDEVATGHMDAQEKADYTEVLLSMVYKRNDYVPAMPFNKQNIRLRIQHLLQNHKPSAGMIALICIALCIGCLALISNPLDRTLPEKADSQRLFDLRTEYAGDAPKAREIIENLSLPEGLRVEQIALQTESEPYGITIQYSGSPVNRNEMYKTLIHDAAIMFGLIINLDTVTFSNNGVFNISYTRDEIYGFYPADYFAAVTSYDSFKELYDMQMMNEALLDELMSYPQGLTADQAETAGYFVNSPSGNKNTEAAENFISEAKAGKTLEMTAVMYTIEGDPIISRIRHDHRGYSCVQDSTRDKYGNQTYFSYAMPYLITIPVDGGVDVYLSGEADLNAERLQRANETGQFISHVYLFHITNE